MRASNDFKDDLTNVNERGRREFENLWTLQLSVGNVGRRDAEKHIGDFVPQTRLQLYIYTLSSGYPKIIMCGSVPCLASQKYPIEKYVFTSPRIGLPISVRIINRQSYYFYCTRVEGLTVSNFRPFCTDVERKLKIQQK